MVRLSTPLALLALSSAPRYSRAFTKHSFWRSHRCAVSLFSTTEAVDMGVAENLKNVQTKVAAAAGDGRKVRLVAVSKTKPVDLLMEAYESGCRIFGENYAQELVGKAKEMPNDIHWHFIGPLQSNKANMLVKGVVPNAASLTVETVATTKLANKLNKAMADFNTANEDVDDSKLAVFVQINTSGEDSKSGLSPGPEVTELCKHITDSCSALRLMGLMTIGAPGDFSCFSVLSDCRSEVSEALGVDPSSLELSMGMSGDYEAAIENGATNVRVGSTIFGARDYSNLTK